MKLYYKPGSCSLAPHIALREAGADFAIELVDTDAQKTETDADFSRVNPNGYVPVLHFDGDQVLTEGPAILQYLADRFPNAELAPKAGTLERVRLQEHLNFLASELHKAFGPLFRGPLSEEEKTATLEKLHRRLDHVERLLSDGRAHLQGDAFTVADAYLFVVASWTGPTGIGLDRWPNLKTFVARVAERPAVREAMRAEGLLN